MLIETKFDSIKISDFDKELTSVFSKIVSLGLEYTNKQVDCVYFLGTNVGNKVFNNNLFFKLSDNIFTINKVNDYVKNEIDDSKDMMYNVLDLLKGDFQEVNQLFLTNDLEAPTEIKLKYDVVTGKFGSDLSYDKRLEKSTTMTANDIFDEWIIETKKGNDGFNW